MRVGQWVGVSASMRCRVGALLSLAQAVLSPAQQAPADTAARLLTCSPADIGGLPVTAVAHFFTFFVHRCLSSVPLKVCSQDARFQALWTHVRVSGNNLGPVRAESQ